MIILGLVAALCGCDTNDSLSETEDLEAVLDEEQLDEYLNLLAEEALDVDVDAIEDEEEPAAADVELSADVAPQTVLAGWVGGTGGSSSEASCKPGLAAIGVFASSTGSLVRQMGLVCGPELSIGFGWSIPAAAQEVIATGYRNGNYNVSSYNNQRSLFDASTFNPLPWLRYKAPGTSYHLCDPGYRLNKVDVREGWLIDRIEGITCWWDGPGGQGPRGLIYSSPVDVGGFGGQPGQSSCQTTGQRFVDGIRFRSGWLLDGFAVDCQE